MGLFGFGISTEERVINLYKALKEKYGDELRKEDNLGYYTSSSADIRIKMFDVIEEYSSDKRGRYGSIKEVTEFSFWYENKERSFYLEISDGKHTHRLIETDGDPDSIAVLLD